MFLFILLATYMPEYVSISFYDYCKPHYHKKKLCCECGHDHDHCNCEHGHHHWKKGARHCDVTVVLRVTAKVFRNRPVLLQQGGMHHGKLPLKPKG